MLSSDYYAEYRLNICRQSVIRSYIRRHDKSTCYSLGETQKANLKPSISLFSLQAVSYFLGPIFFQYGNSFNQYTCTKYVSDTQAIDYVGVWLDIKLFVE